MVEKPGYPLFSWIHFPCTADKAQKFQICQVKLIHAAQFTQVQGMDIHHKWTTYGQELLKEFLQPTKDSEGPEQLEKQILW